jgi:2-polyprenyl-6-methoxyphenol hydroxylase-like FAD-dependent oxidoreductase
MFVRRLIVSMQYGKKVVSLSSTASGVTVTFNDGTNATGSVCIGTDGAQSAVRQLAIPGEAGRAIPMDVVLYNLTVCYGDAERSKEVRKVHFMNSVALHPEKNLSIWTSSKSFTSTCFILLLTFGSLRCA